jgi:uncharacterized protein (TIGR02118 family)
MVVVSVFYPKTDSSHFDHDYYLQKHMPLVRSRFQPMGLTTDTLIRGAAGMDGGKPVFELIGLLTFGSAAQVQAALAKHGQEILGDIPNYTNVSPLMQVNDPIS